MAEESSFIDADEWAESGDWVGVSSSNVDRIRYDADRKYLFVAFKSKRSKRGKRYRGHIYFYSGVSEGTAKAMFRTGSPGRFVHRRLKGQYAYGVI